MEDDIHAVLTTDSTVTREDDNSPNNDFCFTEEDFIETQTERNDATRHQGIQNTTWTAIKELKSEVVNCKSTKDGVCEWTVVESVDEDVFENVREQEETLYNTERFMVRDPGGEFSEDSYSDTFWILWPETIDKDLQTINEVIERDNLKRREEYRREIKAVKKSEFITFHALLIASSAYSCKGDKLWPSKYTHKSEKRCGLSTAVDFGTYMKELRFCQIMNFIACVMEDHSVRETDDWCKFKERVNLYNKKRMSCCESLHILVFDESMSAFVSMYVY